ncbi:MAG: NAD(P)H-dependent oxidoreductase [Candidatus Omnitrophica bacterium]|nr:NAD(P)H-dependent oxidoreductase [Candidatus Omnitrophota bacterium]MCG2705813.1 NAD(P)H-dependent oxidoreductase [Candidatus Omnitrophota bacterium]
MKKLLHIIATPRGKESHTLKVSESFLEAFAKKYPKCVIDTLNVTEEELPALGVKTVQGKYALLSGKDLSGPLAKAWEPVKKHIGRFLSADAYLISTPMWNFSIPYPLKHYIDIIVQPRYLFRYTDKGVEGLVKNKKMLIITSKGGDYSTGSPMRPYDFEETYLHWIFSFVGMTDISFINAQPMDAFGPDVAEKKIEEAKVLAKKSAEEWQEVQSGDKSTEIKSGRT